MRTARPFGAALGVAVVLAGAGACGGGGDSTTGPTGPGGGRTTASVAIPTQVVVASGTSNLAVQVLASYDRRSGAAAGLGTQTIALPGSGAQTLTVPLDLASCLADTARAGGSTATTCSVHLQLTLTGSGVALDAQDAGPFALSGGLALTSSTRITFAQVASVQLVGATATRRAIVGTPLPLTAQVLDATGAVLANRAVRWTSSAPTVATVDSVSGGVTPLAVGSAVITASVAGRTATQTINVVAPAQVVTVAVGSGTGGGSVTSTPAGYTCRISAGVATGTCSASFASDSAVTLQAVPDPGVTIGAWGGDCAAAGTAASCTLTPASARNATVTFLVQRQLRVTPTGIGTGTVTSGTGGPVSCSLTSGTVTGTCTATLLENATVTLTATPDARSTFAGWSGPCTGTAATCVVSLAQAPTVGAVFSPTALATVTLATAGDASGLGGGYVTSQQPGTSGALSCHRIGGLTSGAVCATQFGAGTPVTLTATPDAISTFVGWSGPCSGSATTCTFTPSAGAVSPTATFAAAAGTNGVTVAPSGSGSLTITTTIQSAACDQTQVNRADGGTCIAPWVPAAVPPTVIITATPATGLRFTGWLGCPAGGASGQTCSVSRNGTWAVAAVFAP